MRKLGILACDVGAQCPRNPRVLFCATNDGSDGVELVGTLRQVGGGARDGRAPALPPNELGGGGYCSLEQEPRGLRTLRKKNW